MPEFYLIIHVYLHVCEPNIKGHTIFRNSNILLIIILYPTSTLLMCSSRKYPYLPHGRDFFKTSPPLWKYQLSFIHLSKFFGLAEPPLPRKFQSLPRGEHGHFLELPNKSLPNRLTNIHQSRSILPECYIHVLSQDKHF